LYLATTSIFRSEAEDKLFKPGSNTLSKNVH